SPPPGVPASVAQPIEETSSAPSIIRIVGVTSRGHSTGHAARGAGGFLSLARARMGPLRPDAHGRTHTRGGRPTFRVKETKRPQTTEIGPVGPQSLSEVCGGSALPDIRVS